jgi:cytochrome c
LAALFFAMDTAASSPSQAVTPMPTPDRLAQPTLPVPPSQADYGAQVYWLACLPCHGDRGQGLTEEFREVYPAEDRNCWKSGCHGKSPYENGFTLPTEIPPLIGSGALQKFPTAANLRGYISATMPFWKPGNLTEEESWQVTAFLLQQNGFWQGTAELNESNAGDVNIPRGLIAVAIQNRNELNRWAILVGAALFLSILFFALKTSRNTTTN